MDPKYVTLTIKKIKFNDVQRGFFRGVPKAYIEPTRANEIRITQIIEFKKLIFPDMTKSKLLFFEICLMLKDVLTIGRVLIYPY